MDRGHMCSLAANVCSLLHLHPSSEWVITIQLPNPRVGFLSLSHMLILWGCSGLSAWKYQFLYNHWSQAMLFSVSTLMGDSGSSVVWVLLLTFESARFWLAVSDTACWVCVDAELALGQCRLGAHGTCGLISPRHRNVTRGQAGF